MILLKTKPNEKSTAVFTISFLDEENIEVIPTLSEWQLMKTDGTIVNNRSFANGSFTGNTIVLSGGDLQLFIGDSRKRILAIHALYNSTIGNDLPLNDEVAFQITALVSQENTQPAI